MSYIGDLLEKIKGHTTEIRKAEIGEPDKETAGAGQPNQEDLAAEVTRALENGDISPDTDAVSQWAQGKGMAPDAAEEFAFNVLNAYFDEGSESGEGQGELIQSGDKAPEAGEEVGGKEGEVEDEEELAKSALAAFTAIQEEVVALRKSVAQLNDSNEVMSKALGILLDKAAALDAEQKVIKSGVSQIAGQPANHKEPVLNAPVKPERGHSETRERLLKGVLARELSTEDIAVFEQRGELTAKADAYLKGGSK